LGLLRFLATWLRRLPLRFTLLLIACLLAYLLVVSLLLTPSRLEVMAQWLVDTAGVAGVLVGSEMMEMGAVGIVVLLVFAAGLLLSYNLSALLYRHIRTSPTIAVVAPVEAVPGGGTRLHGFEKIGIILAGGGAKGAYQAGALKAVHAFLEENDALDKVKMVAGTSIGAWNSMFWLGGLVKAPPGGGPSPHEAWWKNIGIDRIIEFDTYWPLRRNHFLRTTPWEEAFKSLFIDNPDVRDRLAALIADPADSGPAANPPLHFYLTRAHVELGHLEFSTNWSGLRGLTRPRLGSSDPNAAEPVVRSDLYDVIEGPDLPAALERMRNAVFASMDLPPLFPYRKVRVDRDEYFEDGGIVENVPIRFGTQLEACDLLFVLPLNASFAETANHTSVSKRIFRAMDVRGGVLERSAFKMVYLYNELAALRARVEALEGAEAPSGPADLERTALQRRHQPVSVFSIVPQAPLVIGTSEFWKPTEAAEAFDLMYEATKHELAENFERDTDPNWIRMARVSPLGERSYVDDF
jgi:predicted acylesterase/phospholipase RssA